MSTNSRNRRSWPIGFRRSADEPGRAPARSRQLQKKPPVSEDELALVLREYRRLREEHRHAGAESSTRRKLESRMEQLRRRFERLVAEAPLGVRARARWTAAFERAVAAPEMHYELRPILFRGRSEAGNELTLLPALDGTVEAFVDGAAVAVIDRADELTRTGSGLGFELDGTMFRETVAAPDTMLVDLRAALEEGRRPRTENLPSLIAEGLLDRELGLTARGRRALDLDRHAARAHRETPVPEILLRGPVPPRMRDELADALAQLVPSAPRPVFHVRGSLARLGNPALERPVVATGMLDLGSRSVRSRAEAATEREAIDLLTARLRRNLRELAKQATAERREAAEW